MNESPLIKTFNLIIALCVISGEVVFANCGSLCVAVKSGICKHVLAMMPKSCNCTLHNYKNVTELQHEADENSNMHAPQPCRDGINHGLKALHPAIYYGRVCFQNTTRR